MAKTKIPKVPKAQFDAVIRALLNAPPMPMSEIGKRKAKANARADNKRRN